jgi:transglutaminase/protease-like cytokinesis protein 3
MKKLLGKLLSLILAIVIAACGFIVLCGINPEVAKGASDASKGLSEYIRSQNPEEAEEGAAMAASTAEDEAGKENALADIIGDVADAASYVSSFTVSEKQEKEFSEYEGNWSSSGIDKDVVKEAEEPMVNQDLSEDPTDDTTYYNITDDMTGLVQPESNVIELETADDVKQAISEISMGSTGTDYTFGSTYYPYYNMLTDKCKQLYKQIYANTLAERTTFLPVTKATPQECNNALMSVIYDHPELFWLNTKMYTEYDYKGNVVKLQLYFYEDELGDIAQARNTFDTMIDSFLAGAAEQTFKTDYDKEVYVHNTLAERLTYKDTPLDQSAYSAIVEKETVCAGYSKAFQLLMQQLDVPTYLSVGWGGGLISGDMHAWNIIKLGDDYYNVDVTWDDQDPVNYNYFNLSDKDFHRHIRMFNSQYLPACNGKKYAKSPTTNQ